MSASTNDDDFWDRVEHDFKVKAAALWFWTTWLLRLGMVTVLFSASYVLIFYILRPANGFFISRLETLTHPVVWALVGVTLIIGGAYLRFRAMGPIIADLKQRGPE